MSSILNAWLALSSFSSAREEEEEEEEEAIDEPRLPSPIFRIAAAAAAALAAAAFAPSLPR